MRSTSCSLFDWHSGRSSRSRCSCGELYSLDAFTNLSRRCVFNPTNATRLDNNLSSQLTRWYSTGRDKCHHSALYQIRRSSDIITRLRGWMAMSRQYSAHLLLHYLVRAAKVAGPSLTPLGLCHAQATLAVSQSFQLFSALSTLDPCGYPTLH